MKIAVRFIYYKAVEPSKVYVLNMSTDEYRAFWNASISKQKEILCQLAGYDRDTWSHKIRFAAWIPLSDKYEIVKTE
jgi:hypothetical protein